MLRDLKVVRRAQRQPAGFAWIIEPAHSPNLVIVFHGVFVHPVFFLRTGMRLNLESRESRFHFLNPVFERYLLSRH
jgi:hypothetical protein